MAKPTPRQAWMRRFETAILRLDPTLAGHVDWDTAIYLFGQGCSAEMAAEQVAQQHSGRASLADLQDRNV